MVEWFVKAILNQISFVKFSTDDWESCRSPFDTSLNQEYLPSTTQNTWPWARRYLDGVFADSKSVPELDGLVTGARNNLAVISREGHAQDILGVSNESPGCCTTEETLHKAFAMMSTFLYSQTAKHGKTNTNIY